MKLIKEDKEFKPFQITLKVETEGEARTLFHVFNNLYIHGVIKGTNPFYPMNGYSTRLSSIQCSEVSELIKDHVNVYDEEQPRF